MIKNIVENIVKKIVSSPQEVSITSSDSDGKIINKVSVWPADLARIIGKDGRTFKALRSLVIILSNEKEDLVLDTGAK